MLELESVGPSGACLL